MVLPFVRRSATSSTCFLRAEVALPLEARTPEEVARAKDEEMINVMKEITKINASLGEQRGASRSVQGRNDFAVSDMASALTGIQFKQSLPVVKDSDVDLERDLREPKS